MMNDWVALGFCLFPTPSGAAGPGDLGAGKLNRTPSVLLPRYPGFCLDRYLSAMTRGQPQSLHLSAVRGLHLGRIMIGHWRWSRGLPGASMAGRGSGFDIHISSEGERVGWHYPQPHSGGLLSSAFWFSYHCSPLNPPLSDCPSTHLTLPYLPWISGYELLWLWTFMNCLLHAAPLAPCKSPAVLATDKSGHVTHTSFPLLDPSMAFYCIINSKLIPINLSSFFILCALAMLAIQFF